MKRLFLTLSIGAFTALSGMAQEAATTQEQPQQPTTDSITIIRPERVTIETRGDLFSVQVEGREGNPDFRYSRRAVLAEGEPVITEERERDWNFRIPFSDLKHKPARSRKGKSEVSILGIGIGWVTALDAPEEMDVDMGSSYEIMAPSLVRWSYYPANRVALSIGVGLDWRNYRMTGRTRFLKEGSDLLFSDYPEGADIRFSRLKVFSWMVPLQMELDLGRSVMLSLGPVLNFNTHASLKTRYTTAEGAKVKETDSNIHPSRVTIDLMAHLGFRGVGVYVKYSPCKVLNDAYGPSFRGLSAGLTLFY